MDNRHDPETRGDIQRQLETVADELHEQRHQLIRAQRRALTDFVEYENVPDEDLQRSCERNVARVVAVLRGEERLPPGVIEDERRSGERRARQEIPAEVVVAAYRAVIAVIRDAFLEQATLHGISPAATLLGTQRLWDQADHSSSELVSARHQHDLDQARHQERNRMAFLRGVIDGSLHGADLLAAGGEHRILENGAYWVVRTRPPADVMSATVRELARRGRTPDFDPVIGLFSIDVVAVLGRRLVVAEHSGPAAVVGPVAPNEFAHAFGETSQILDAALLLELDGVVDHDRIGLRLAVAAERSVGPRLHARYVEPVRRGSTMSEDILHSIRVLLRLGRSISRAANDLSVHVNTLRYRVERFETLTSCSLDSGDTFVEVWWALEYDRLKHHGPAKPRGG